MKSRTFTLTIILTLGIALFASLNVFASAERTVRDEPVPEERSRFEISVSYGYEGYSRENGYTPVVVHITNNGEQFHGSLQVILDKDYQGSNIAYENTFTMSQGASFDYVVDLPDVNTGMVYSISLLDEQGAVHYSEVKRISLENTSEIYIGLISAQADRLDYLNGMEFDLGEVQLKSRTFNLYNDNSLLHRYSSNSLDPLDIIVLNGYEESDLSEYTAGILDRWVKNGGILVIDGQEEFTQLSSGHGYRLYLDYDLDEDSLLSSEHLSLATIVRNYLPYRTVQTLADVYSSEKYNYWTIWSVISNAFGKNTPSVIVYIVILIIYILFVPILYLVLKKLDKRWVIWPGVIVWSVIFSALIIFVGKSTRLIEPFVDYVSFIELDKDNYELTHMAVTAPLAGDYDLSVDDAYDVYYVPENSGWYTVGPLEDIQDRASSYTFGIERKENEVEISLRDFSSFRSGYFILQREDMELGDLDVQVTWDGEKYIGTVTNMTGYDLTDAALITSWDVIRLPDLVSGEVYDLAQLDDDAVISAKDNGGTIQLLRILGFENYEDYDKNGTLNDAAKLNALYCYLISDVYEIGKLHFVGLAMDYKPAISEDNLQMMNGIGLFTNVDTINYNYNGRVEIPDIIGYSNIAREIYADESIYDEREISYELDYNLDVEKITIDKEYLETYSIRVYFYNIEAGYEEEVFIDNDTISGSDIHKYVSDTNLLKVRFEMTDMDYWYYNDLIKIPALSVSGRER